MLRTMGETHRIFGGFQRWLIGQVRGAAGDDGNADTIKLAGLIQRVEGEWRATVQRWVDMFTVAREQAAGIPFGALVVKHNHYRSRLQEAMSAQDVGTIVTLWQQRRERALAATRDRIYGDGLNLSQRIWRLENEGLTLVRSTLATAMDGRTNAADLARQLEPLLGADQDMPRWTRERLYNMTARERTTDSEGLLKGSENRTRGISYNALRLARNELQHANHAVTTEIAKHSPWVTGRKVTLSSSHPEPDICDELAAGGPYPVEDEVLPAHPSCFCFYTEVLMKPADFAKQVSGWLNGDNNFLDDYQDWLGVQDVTEPLPMPMSLADSLELWLSTNQGAHAAALRVN